MAIKKKTLEEMALEEDTRIEKIDVVMGYNNSIHVFGRNPKLPGCYYMLHNGSTGEVLKENTYKKISDYYDKLIKVEQKINAEQKIKNRGTFLLDYIPISG